ncbi:sensor domain-containing diguanylate cyclase [Paraburkholderia caballeronis]|uniref:sensor domain-containing diguanylate cyclase n=1 Tax=Paraburkholderia caballeronis TaxID=416943 RepID=UPI001065FA6D|nr:sensor domain-containing diguanylate cyclase [Paraburkholderia caballeronis]TDV16340.1 diguanylate cyclase (GGDEF)-like protein [Paraburkholderia caballeronis]TDV20690.1 diguanylate cyclase (GGDEF)-like protein [Paraburkholderia caballeronis]TDV33158.1 diguanylate cyclase (GGDEF)-like protein [Paraburkholderia caballeronis]
MDEPANAVPERPAASRLRRAGAAAIAAATRLIGNRPYAVGIAGTVIAAIVAAVPLIEMEAGRRDAMEHARETSENLSWIIALDLERNFRFHDVQLQEIVRSAEDPRTWVAPPDLQNRLLFRDLPDDAYVDGEFVVGAAGQIVASQDGSEVSPVLRLDDRDYFLKQKQDPSAGLVVSHPFRSRLHNGKLSIALTRRLNAPDGAFAGVAMFEVRLEFFQRLFERINVAEPGIVAITLDDGTLLGVKPYADETSGVSVADTAAFRQIAARDGGSAVLVGSGNVERIYTWRHVSGLPFVAVVAPATDDVLKSWRHQRRIVGSIAVLFGAALALGAWMLAYTLRDKLRAQAELARQATTDPLTKLSNRRTLDERLHAEWNRALRERGSLSVLFIDIDRFKLYNDTFGHAAGDRILATVATRIAAAARRSVDVVARYGGEEFTVVLPDTGHDGAVQVAETIRASVEALRIENPGSDTGLVTVSVGCATCRPTAGREPETLVSTADEQLYVAKSSGRNQVRAIVLE